MSEPAPFPKQADELKLRARPQPVTRINRKVLMAGICVGVLGLFAAASIALDPPKAVHPADRQELYNTETKRAPDGLSDLPSSYLNWQPAAGTPRLGVPMAGDLGGTVVAEEEEWGLEPDWNVAPSDDFRPSAEDEALRAQRLADAKLADAAGRADVFFDVGNRQLLAGSVSETGRLPNSLGSDFLKVPAQGAGPPGFAVAPDRNFQAEKIAFAAEKRNGDIYNPHDVETPVSPYQVMAGTLIPASLVTGLNSDLPGSIIAQVTQPVYDTVSGAHLLIPQGARLIGRYQSEVSFGQERALLVWDRIILPDGSSLQISEPASDAQGYAGVSDRTDHHWDRVFAAAGLATLLGIGSELGSDDDDVERAIRRGFGDSVSEAGQRVVDRNLGIQPTIRIRPGWPVRVIVTRDLVLRPYLEGARP
ncbi:TrbI/VirB10 family protein [Hyphomonas atlantica]|uniref:Conjugal transfer protein TrbI n=1 Tax=Hyphomonas atlantica TaxID=1280948 RepID=A0A059E1F5_9PROT|nr:TrbI/VirB10 family protein [Hyphomonas atlantica]KCZ61463.1 conjugal transfer protein TrbI [Hyphomonas atlantica]